MSENSILSPQPFALLVCFVLTLGFARHLFEHEYLLLRKNKKLFHSAFEAHALRKTMAEGWLTIKGLALCLKLDGS
jgi:hypothetical protein